MNPVRLMVDSPLVGALVLVLAAFGGVAFVIWRMRRDDPAIVLRQPESHVEIVERTPFFDQDVADG